MFNQGKGELTPAEERIVELVCRGWTNRQVGAELYIEPSTVQWHLKNVFRKLGVTTRSQLVVRRLTAGTPTESDISPQMRQQSPPNVGQASAAEDETTGSAANHTTAPSGRERKEQR